MTAIASAHARQILDSRGNPTVEVDVRLESGAFGRAAVPSGASTGQLEAIELRDGGAEYGGKAVTQAVAHVDGELGAAVRGLDAADQKALDAAMIELDGTPNKGRLGANAILGISLAAAKAAAAEAGVPLYRWLGGDDARTLPVPMMNVINGGAHAQNSLDLQEFMLVPAGAPTFAEALRIGSETFHALKNVLHERGFSTGVGDEGGFAPPISEPAEALEQLHLAVDRAGHASLVVYGLDCAASHFYDQNRGVYELAGKPRTVPEMMSLYESFASDFGVVSFEDPFHEDDFAAFAELTGRIDAQVVGDDLLVTNAARVERAQDMGAANALLLKVNQAGTLSEALAAARQAVHGGWSIVVSERSGETEDPLIADLVVGLNAGQIKTGAPVRGERTAKYNRLLQIEEELGSAAVYAGRRYRHPR